jgi:hypothetical protein
MLIGHSISDALGQILAVDHAIYELLHRSEAKLIGMSYVSITHPDDATWKAPLVDKLRQVDGRLLFGRDTFVRMHQQSGAMYRYLAWGTT